MAPVPYILRLIDATERFTPHHLWDGDRLYGVPMLNGRRAIAQLWELRHGQRIPFRHTLVATCGYEGCMRLDHHRLVTWAESLRRALRRRVERHFAALEAA